MMRLNLGPLFGLCVIVLTSTGVWGQSEDEPRNELRELRQELQRIAANQELMAIENKKLAEDNQSLRRLLDESLPQTSDLEHSINALASKLSEGAGTTLNSNANPITLSGAFRFRAGFTSDRDFGGDGGAANDASDDNGTFVDARVNIAFDFELDRHVTAHFELIANGLYDNGATDARTGRFSDVDLYQGWVLIDKLFGHDEVGLRTGRQEIVLGDQFHFGNNDFFGGETFDSTLIWWGQEEFSITFIWAKLAIDDNFNASNHPYNGYLSGGGYDDDEIYALYFTLKTIEDHVLDIYWVYFNGNNGGTVGTFGNTLGAGFDYFVHALGARIAGVFDVASGLDYKVEFTYETGDLSGTSIDVDNWALEAGLGITLNADNKLRIFARFLFAEGSDGSDSGFVTVFANRHMQPNWDDHTAIQARYGIMDIIPMSNVLTGQVGFTVNPSDNWQFGATFLGAWHDEDVVATDASAADGIGYEIDVFAHYRHSKETTISMGLGVFLPEDGAPLVGGGFASDNEDDPTFLVFLQTLTTF